MHPAHSATSFQPSLGKAPETGPSSLWPPEYAGQWVAWDRATTRIVARGATFAEAAQAARAGGEPDPILVKVPRPEQLAGTVPAQVVEAQHAFRQALPRLLAERPGQWVAYHGTRLVGFAAEQTELFGECQRQGIPRGEVLIRCIEPETDPLSFGPGVLDVARLWASRRNP